jgi:xylan 1,4-beta-xylosidase
MTTHRIGWRLVLVAIALMVACAPSTVELLGQAGVPSQNETITINARAASQPFPHSWERVFGSGRAILSLRDSYRRDLRAVKQATGFE